MPSPEAERARVQALLDEAYARWGHWIPPGGMTEAIEEQRKRQTLQFLLEARREREWRERRERERREQERLRGLERRRRRELQRREDAAFERERLQAGANEAELAAAREDAIDRQQFAWRRLCETGFHIEGRVA